MSPHEGLRLTGTSQRHAALEPQCIADRSVSVNVSGALVGEHVGLEEVDDGQWDVYFGALKLGRLHERVLRIEDHLGRLQRRRS